MVESYQVINLLDCLGKVVEKLVAEELFKFCEANAKLYQGQMGARKKMRLAIDVTAI